MSIILLKTPDWATHRTVQEAVFSDINSTNQFALGFIKSNAQIDITELMLPDENGLAAGTGLFRITGKVSIAQNNLFVLGQLERNAAKGTPGGIYRMNFLMRDGTALSVAPDPGTKETVDSFRSYLFDRFPLLADWGFATGVRFALSSSLGGSNLTHTFDLSGFTFVTVQYQPPADFYSDFPYLNVD